MLVSPLLDQLTEVLACLRLEIALATRGHQICKKYMSIDNQEGEDRRCNDCSDSNSGDKSGSKGPSNPTRAR